MLLIGSTGSVGTQALDVVRENPEQFRIAALTAHKNLDSLLKQIEEFHPRAVGISDEQTYRMAKHIIHTDCELFGGENAHVEAMLASKADTSLISVVGFPGFAPLRESIIHGLKTCVANKESIVCGGAAITRLLQNTTRGFTLWIANTAPFSNAWRETEIKKSAGFC
ncbi:MAG: 1-deoxy-D-xylulose-5-phosphate reductoisomerase [Christensenellales bacterium]